MKSWILIVVFIALLFLTPANLRAAVIRLDPTTASIPLGAMLDVAVSLDTQGSRVLSSDVKLGFDPNVVEVVAVRNGTLFEKYLHTVSPQYVFLSGGNRTTPAVGTGLLGTIVLRGRAFGVSSLRFDCRTGKTFKDFINIENEDGEDIVSCSSLANGVYSVTIPADSRREDSSVYGLSLSDYGLSPTPVTIFRGLLARPIVSKAPTPIKQVSPTGTIKGASTNTQTAGPSSIVYAATSLSLLLFGVLAAIIAIII